VNALGAVKPVRDMNETRGKQDREMVSSVDSRSCSSHEPPSQNFLGAPMSETPFLPSPTPSRRQHQVRVGGAGCNAIHTAP